MSSPDVLIIGAGLAGLSVAWHLAPTHRVLVVDQGAQPGAEATAQNAGMVRRLVEDPVERAIATRSGEAFAAPGEDWEDHPPSRVVGAVLGLVEEDAQLTDAVAHLQRRGVKVHSLDRPEEVAPALRGSPLRQAWWLPQERVADPHALLSGFLRGLRRHGGALRLGSAVEGLAQEGDRVIGAWVGGELVRAGAVVIAAGAWGQGLAAGIGLVRPLAPIRRSLHTTAPHPLSRPEHPWLWLDDLGLYARPEGEGWLLSGCDERLDRPALGPGSLGGLTEAGRAELGHKLERALPALADVGLRGGWTGLRTFTPDRRPMLGEDPDRQGLWWASGLGGAGVTGCFAVGEAVATWMRGEETPWLPRRAVSPGRPFPARFLIHPSGESWSGQLISAR
ncbi:MAG: FAD-binding oxidoreductase [Deltaproteobacteria bacterium]|nr:FAD-binding oxidoreductase [Deltaproteobacteria bacterium]